MFADRDALQPIFTLVVDRLRHPEDPDVDVELRQFLARDGIETRIVGGRAIGGNVHGLVQGNAKFDVAAAGAQPSGPAQRDERAVDGQIGHAAQCFADRLAIFPPHGRRHTLPGRTQQTRLSAPG